MAANDSNDDDDATVWKRSLNSRMRACASLRPDVLRNVLTTVDTTLPEGSAGEMLIGHLSYHFEALYVSAADTKLDSASRRNYLTAIRNLSSAVDDALNDPLNSTLFDGKATENHAPSKPPFNHHHTKKEEIGNLQAQAVLDSSQTVEEQSEDETTSETHNSTDQTNEDSAILANGEDVTLTHGASNMNQTAKTQWKVNEGKPGHVDVSEPLPQATVTPVSEWFPNRQELRGANLTSNHTRVDETLHNSLSTSRKRHVDDNLLPSSSAATSGVKRKHSDGDHKGKNKRQIKGTPECSLQGSSALCQFATLNSSRNQTGPPDSSPISRQSRMYETQQSLSNDFLKTPLRSQRNLLSKDGPQPVTPTMDGFDEGDQIAAYGSGDEEVSSLNRRSSPRKRKMRSCGEQSSPKRKPTDPHAKAARHNSMVSMKNREESRTLRRSRRRVSLSPYNRADHSQSTTRALEQGKGKTINNGGYNLQEIGVKLPVNDAHSEMCFSWHVMGKCNETCTRAADHITHNNDEDKKLYLFCKRYWYDSLNS